MFAEEQDHAPLRDWTDTSKLNSRRVKVALSLALTVICLGSVSSLASPKVTTHLSNWANTRIDGFQATRVAKCIIQQPTGYNNGGYGDYLRLSHRCELAAQTLGCECVRPIVQSAHNYTASELLSGAAYRIELKSSRACSLADVIDIEELEAGNFDCDLKIVGNPDRCDIYTYNPSHPIYNTYKLRCVSERMRRALMALPPPSEERLKACPDGYLAIHKRWGDLATFTKDPRNTTPREVKLGIEHAQKLHPHWPKECFVVFAEGYPHAQVEDVDLPHVVDTNTDLKQVMSDMVHSEILLVGASGLMMPIGMLFKGSELLIVRGIKERYEGVVRKNVLLTAIGP